MMGSEKTFWKQKEYLTRRLESLGAIYKIKAENPGLHPYDLFLLYHQWYDQTYKDDDLFYLRYQDFIELIVNPKDPS